MTTLIDLLGLTRPLIIVDTEAHDFLSPEQSHIVQLAFRKMTPGAADREWSSYINPGVPIAKIATEKHHITDAMVAGSPSFAQIAANLAGGFTDCDFGGYHVAYDIKLLKAEFNRASVAWSYKDARILDGLRIWQHMRPHTLSDACRRILGREPTGAHDAAGDVKDSVDVLNAEFERWPDLPRDLQKIHNLCFPSNPDAIDADGKFVWRGDMPVINFGKHNGQPFSVIDKGFWIWVLKNDFSEEVKAIARQAREGIFPVRNDPEVIRLPDISV